MDSYANWRKSSYSGNVNDACVEAASCTGAVAVRDTTNRTGATLTVSAAAWQRFTADLK